MSEINSYGFEVVWGRPLPGWYLCQLLKPLHHTTPKMMVGQFEMKDKSWGLTQCNDPDFVFDLTPVKEPLDDSPNYDEEMDLFLDTIEHYDERLTGDVYNGYRLVSDCIKEGYNQDTDGSVAAWLVNYLACWLEKHPQPEKIYDY